MKRVIKNFLNGETGSRSKADLPETNFSEKMDAHFLVVILKGGFNDETGELQNESVEVVWADEADLMKCKVGTVVLL